MLTIRPAAQIAGPLDFLQSVGAGLVHAVEQVPGLVSDTLQMGCKLAQTVPAAAAGPYAAYAAAAQAGCGLLAPGQVAQGGNAALPQQQAPTTPMRYAAPTAVYSKYPAGSIARWHPRKSQWWIFYPGNPTTLGDTLSASPNGFRLMHGASPNGFHLLSDPTPDAVETGTETQQPAGTQKGPDVKTPFYKKWETYAIAGGVAVVGGVVVWLVLR